jgi:hypothetical protein
VRARRSLSVAAVALREHRTQLSATVRRLERDIAESDAALGATPAARADAICGPADGADRHA